MYTHSARISFGRWLETKRVRCKLKKSELALAIGYNNLNKGCRRILQWEKGDQFPHPQQIVKLQQALSITQHEWEQKVQEIVFAKTKDALYGAANTKIETQTKQYLTRHFSLLMKNAEKIFEVPSWRHIHLHGLKVGMMYIGGCSSVQLGALLASWKKGKLTKETDKGRYRAFSGGGSPLSGMQSFEGFYEGENVIRTHKALARPLASFLGPVISAFRKYNMATSAWSLAQLLSQFGVSLPNASIWQNDEEVGSYHFQDAQLVWKGKTIDFPLQLDDAYRYVPTKRNISEEWGPSHHKGVPILGDLLTGQLGEWKGERWELLLEDGKWLIRSGSVYDPHQYPVLRWDMDLPPLVQEWLVRNCATTNR